MSSQNVRIGSGPPYMHRSSNPDGFIAWWRKLYYVFNLPSPYEFPAIEGLTADDRRELARYAANCAELAETTILSHAGSFSMHVDNEAGTIETSLTTAPKDAVRGAAVLFRLVSSDDETGGYGRTWRILERRAATGPGKDARALEVLKAWRAARGKLLARMLDQLVAEKMYAEGIGGYPPDAAKPGPSPSELISLFDYGDLIHQGRKLDAFERSREDEHGHAWATYKHLTAVLQLSHFYLGYGVLTESALGRSASERL